MAKFTGKVTGTVVGESWKTVAPGLGGCVDAAKYGARFTGRLGLVTLRWPDPPTLYKGELGVLKKAAWSDPISIGRC